MDCPLCERSEGLEKGGGLREEGELHCFAMGRLCIL